MFFRHQITIGAVLAGIAVALGAFGAHGLDSFLVEAWGDATKTVAGQEVAASWKYLQDFKTAANYQMFHALGLISVGLLSVRTQTRSLKIASVCFVAGIVFFSGSLYTLVLTQKTWLGAIAPIGGTLFMVGWVALAIGACPCGQREPEELTQLAEPPNPK